MSDPKQTLEDFADILYAQAVDAHAEGMALLERSTRIRQLAVISSPNEAAQLVRDLEIDGLMDSSQTNSKGGDA